MSANLRKLTILRGLIFAFFVILLSILGIIQVIFYDIHIFADISKTFLLSL